MNVPAMFMTVVLVPLDTILMGCLLAYVTLDILEMTYPALLSNNC